MDLIPIKCVTCGCVLADKYRYYKSESRRLKQENMENADVVDKVMYFTKKNMDKTPEGHVLDKIKLTKVCCRRHMLTQPEA